MTGDVVIAVVVTAAGTLLAPMLWEPVKSGFSRLDLGTHPVPVCRKRRGP